MTRNRKCRIPDQQEGEFMAAEAYIFDTQTGEWKSAGTGEAAVSSFAPNKANFPCSRPENEGWAEKQSQSKPIGTGGALRQVALYPSVQSKPNFPCFRPGNGGWAEKQSQSKPIFGADPAGVRAAFPSRVSGLGDCAGKTWLGRCAVVHWGPWQSDHRHQRNRL